MAPRQTALPATMGDMITAKRKQTPREADQSRLQRENADHRDNERRLLLEIMELRDQRDRAIAERDAHRDLSTTAAAFIAAFDEDRAVEFSREWVRQWLDPLREAMKPIPEPTEDLPTEMEARSSSAA